ETDRPPGADALIEQDDQLLACVDVRFLAAEIKQFAFGVPADEFEIVEDELTRKKLFDLAARGDVAVTAERQLGCLQSARRQSQGADQLLDERRCAGQSPPLDEIGEYALEGTRLIEQHRPGDLVAGFCDGTASVPQQV